MMTLLFAEWLQQNEGLTVPDYVERPDENLRKDAEEGRPQALPTYDLPKKAKKRMKRMKR